MPEPTLRWLAALGVCTGVLTACSSVVEQSNISYDDRYGVDVFDVYNPPPAAGPRPAVIVIHGGGWAPGIYRSSMATYAQRLADAGYVTVNIEYRLTPDGQFPRAVQDCFCALAYMRGHATELGIDPDRIAGLGYSAGGHLVSMLGTAAADPIVAPDCAAGPAAPLDAVVSGAGAEDMASLLQVSGVIDFVGAPLSADPKLYAEASPLSHVAVDDPPFLFIQGDNDWFVPFDRNAKPMQAALDAVGTETRLLEIPGGGHIWNRGANSGDWEVPMASLDSPESEAAMIDFLDHTVGPPP